MSANDRQVGGNHYRKKKDLPQHWDLAIMYQWDPFQYQITKYVMRWKDKHLTPQQKLTDLKKAAHFLEKYIENFEEYLSPACVPDEAEQQKQEGSFRRYEKEQSQYTGDNHYRCEGGWGDGRILYTCQYCSDKIFGMSLLAAHEQHDHKCPKGDRYEVGRINANLGQAAQSSQAMGGSPVPGILEQGGAGRGNMAGTGYGQGQENTGRLDKPGTGRGR